MTGHNDHDDEATMTKRPTRRKPRKPIPPHERFRALLDSLGISLRGASTFLGLGERTPRRWATKPRRHNPPGHEVPISIMMLLEIMDAFEVTPAEARKLADRPQPGVDYAAKGTA